MRITFIGYGTEQLGISQLSAIAREAGHEVSLVFTAGLFADHYNLDLPVISSFFDERRQLVDEIVRQRPELLVASPLTSTWAWTREVLTAARLRLPETKVLVGGVHATAAPKHVLAGPEVDFVGSGEGDLAFPALLKALEDGGPRGPIDNLLYEAADGSVVRGRQAPFVQDLSALPHFDKRLWEDHLRLGDFYLTMASRGCPFRCTFCFNSFFATLPEGRRGPYVRMRSVDHVIAELRAAKRRYRLRVVDFEDDVFTVNKPWLKALLDRYRREIGVPFICLSHPKYVDDDVARWLGDAGCTWVQMGVQSADEEFRNRSLNRPDHDADLERAVILLRRHGVQVKLDHIFGLPEEPSSAQETALELYKRMDVGRIQTFWTTLLPGTVLFEQELASGRLSSEDARRILDGDTREFFRLGPRGSGSDNEGWDNQMAYEILFRMMPLLPSVLRDRVEPRHVAWMPSPVRQAVASGADLLNAALRRNPDHWLYALHYADQIARYGKRRIFKA